MSNRIGVRFPGGGGGANKTVHIRMHLQWLERVVLE